MKVHLLLHLLAEHSFRYALFFYRYPQSCSDALSLLFTRRDRKPTVRYFAPPCPDPPAQSAFLVVLAGALPPFPSDLVAPETPVGSSREPSVGQKTDTEIRNNRK